MQSSAIFEAHYDISPERRISMLHAIVWYRIELGIKL